MFGITNETRVYLKTGVTDGRLSYEGLRGLVSKVIAQDVRAGHLFAFCNRRENRVKLLWHHAGGLYLAAKRLDRGTVQWPRDAATAVCMSVGELQALLQGVQFKHANESVARRHWR
jgi:transposase